MAPMTHALQRRALFVFYLAKAKRCCAWSTMEMDGFFCFVVFDKASSRALRHSIFFGSGSSQTIRQAGYRLRVAASK